MIPSKTLTLVVGLFLSASAASQATLYVVPGTSNPWLAGVGAGGTDPASGSSYGGEAADVAPYQSPIHVIDGFVVPGALIGWSATGTVGHPGNDSGPDGSVVVSRVWGAQNGIPDIGVVPINALIGVFTGATPSVFVMGSSGTVTVPAGSTGFYMGTMDGYGWANNTGEFNVSVTAVPEPGTYLAGLSALGMLGMFAWRNRK